MVNKKDKFLVIALNAKQALIPRHLDTYSEFGHMAIKGRPFLLTYKGGSPELNFIAKLFRLT